MSLQAGGMLEPSVPAGQVSGKRRMRGTATPVSLDGDPEDAEGATVIQAP